MKGFVGFCAMVLVLVPGGAWGVGDCGLKSFKLEVALSEVRDGPAIFTSNILKMATDNCGASGVTLACWQMNADQRSGAVSALATLSTLITEKDAACAAETNADMVAWADGVGSTARVVRAQLQYAVDMYDAVNPGP